MSSFEEIQACCTPDEDAAALFGLCVSRWQSDYHTLAADPATGAAELGAAKRIAEFLLAPPLCKGLDAKQQGKVRMILTQVDAMLVSAEPEPEPAPKKKGGKDSGKMYAGGDFMKAAPRPDAHLRRP